MTHTRRLYSSEVNGCKKKFKFFDCVKSVVYQVYPIRMMELENFLLDTRKTVAKEPWMASLSLQDQCFVNRYVELSTQ